MRIFVSLFLFILLMVCPVVAQTTDQDKPIPDNTILIGGYVSTDSTTPLLSGAYRRYTTSRFYLMTMYDVSNIKFYPLNLTHAQYTATEEIWYYVASPHPKLSLFLRGGAGLVGTSGVSTSRTLGGGGAADLKIGTIGHIVGTVGGTNNPLVGSKLEIRAYIGVGW